MFTRLVAEWPFRPPAVRWGMREAFLCFVAAQFIAGFWAAAAGVLTTENGLSSTGIATIVISNIGLWIAYYFGPAIISRNLGQGPQRDFNIGLSLREGLAAAVLGVALQVVVLPLLYWPILKIVDADPGATAQELVDRVEGPIDVALLALAVVLIAPLVEERFYRGMLLPSLTSAMGPLVGILGSSFIFALVHREAITLPGLMVLACVLAWLTASTGRVGPAVVAHMAFNATSVVQLLAMA